MFRFNAATQRVESVQTSSVSQKQSLSEHDDMLNSDQPPPSLYPAFLPLWLLPCPPPVPGLWRPIYNIPRKKAQTLKVRPRRRPLHTFNWNITQNEEAISHESVFKDMDIADKDYQLDWQQLDALFLRPPKKKRKKKKKTGKRTKCRIHYRRPIAFVEEEVVDGYYEPARWRQIHSNFVHLTEEMQFIPQDLRDAVFSLHIEDEKVNSFEFVQKLSLIVPTEQERLDYNRCIQTRKYTVKDDVPRFRPLERFWYYVRALPYLSIRCHLWLFQLEFDTLLHDYSEKIRTVESMFVAIKDHKDMRKIFELVLVVGNYINYGHAKRGNAFGFQLDTFRKLKELHSKQAEDSQRRYTLLMYVVEMVHKNYPQLMHWVGVFDHCERCMQIDLTRLERDIAVLLARIRNLDFQLQRIKETEMSEQKAMEAEKDSSECKDQFEGKMTRFVKYANEKYDALHTEWSNMTQSGRNVATMFGERLSEKYTLWHLMRSFVEVRDLWYEATAHLFWREYVVYGYIREIEENDFLYSYSTPTTVVDLIVQYFSTDKESWEP